MLAVLFALKARTSGYNYSAEKVTILCLDSQSSRAHVLSQDPFASADVSAMIATVIELFTNVESVTVKQEILRAIPAMMKVCAGVCGRGRWVYVMQTSICVTCVEFNVNPHLPIGAGVHDGMALSLELYDGHYVDARDSRASHAG